MIGDVVIRPFQPGDSVSSITELLHASYARLAAMGFAYVATHQDDDVTRSRLERGDAFVAVRGEVIVGTITLYGTTDESPSPWYGTEGVMHFGQFGVAPAWQGRGLGARMLERIEQQARARGAVELALDTAEGADHLRRWYHRLGYRFAEFVSWDETNYRSVILSKRLRPSS